MVKSGKRRKTKGEEQKYKKRKQTSERLNNEKENRARKQKAPTKEREREIVPGTDRQYVVVVYFFCKDCERE